MDLRPNYSVTQVELELGAMIRVLESGRISHFSNIGANAMRLSLWHSHMSFSGRLAFGSSSKAQTIFQIYALYYLIC